jgi:hypothetical protein
VLTEPVVSGQVEAVLPIVMAIHNRLRSIDRLPEPLAAVAKYSMQETEAGENTIWVVVARQDQAGAWCLSNICFALQSEAARVEPGHALFDSLHIVC